MSEAAATVNFSAQTTELGDRIADLTLKQAKELSDYLEQKYGIKPAAGGGVMMAGRGAVVAKRLRPRRRRRSSTWS